MYVLFSVATDVVAVATVAAVTAVAAVTVAPPPPVRALTIQAAGVKMATPKTSSQHCGVRYRSPNAGGIYDLNGNKRARVRAKNAQYVVRGKVRKIKQVSRFRQKQILQ